MSISSTTRTAGPYTGTGLVSAYPFAFKVFQTSDVLVVQADTAGAQSTLTLSLDYSVTLNADQGNNPGGTVNLVAPLTSLYQLTITSNVPTTQPATLTNLGGFFPKVVENALDRLTILFQQLGLVGTVQALRVPEIGGIPAFPNKAARANKIAAFDSVGDPVALVGTDGSSATALDLSLRDKTTALKGAGQVGADTALSYVAGTIGWVVQDNMVNAMWFLTDAERADVIGRVGSIDVTAKLDAARAFCFALSGASSRTLFIPRGVWKASLDWASGSGVSIEGDGAKHTIIKPTISSGYAFSADTSLYNQTFRKFTIDGTNCTGTAGGIYIKKGNRTVFDQVNISGFTSITKEAMLIEGAGYSIDFRNCHFSNNYRHWLIQRLAPAGDFTTEILFDRCVFEGATNTSGSAMKTLNVSGVMLRNCIVQANLCLYTMEFQCTSAAETGDDPQIVGGWWEDNGGGQAGSIGIYLHGAVARKLFNPVVRDVKFHQSTINKPAIQIQAEYTDGMQVTGCSEGFGAGATFLKDGTNNTNYLTELSRVTSASELMSPTVWATGSFNGKGGISSAVLRNCAVTRAAAGSYTVTFTKAAPFSSYVVNGYAEDGTTVNAMVFSPGINSSTSSFSIATTPSNSATLTDARTVTFEVSVFK